MSFEERHLGQRPAEINDMLAVCGLSSVEKLIDKTIPSAIRNTSFDVGTTPLSEHDFLHFFQGMADKNRVAKNFIGMGYYGTLMPTVIQRNILENPSWYTAYTPYQAEIAQGRLEMLLNFQTMITDLTGMEIANASLLDEATAAAEAISMAYAVRNKKSKKQAKTVFVDENTHPQTIALLKTRTEPLGLEIKLGNPFQDHALNEDNFALLLSYPGSDGSVEDFKALAESSKEKDVMVIVCTDLLALTILTPPGEWSADIVIGSAQRFGVPMGYGGPHAAFIATSEKHKRQIPGRIIGMSKDRFGKPALRMALQTREQHIRREKATSNICTAQVLLAVISAAYTIYHGPERLKAIATRVHGLAKSFAEQLQPAGITIKHGQFFDTVTILTDSKSAIINACQEENINLRQDINGELSVSFDETHTQEDVDQLVKIIKAFDDSETNISRHTFGLNDSLLRTSNFMELPVFNSYHTEHEMLRYLKKLESRDLSLVHSMIALGSCTMKLNSTTEMIPVSWTEWNGLHPFAPADQAQGYYEMMAELGHFLKIVTGFDGVSFQPNSGAQGEYAGLMVIRALHIDKGQGHRNIALIPSSAHGTNPASAVMAGMEVVVVGTDDQGNIDVEDLKAKAEKHSETLSCLMITYPSTHGVFEETIQEICELIHHHGGRVYMDGANMNAQVGLTSPGKIGADVCHLNLHKTFCIPHGGGGPGMGPICCTAELAPYLPGHPIVQTGGNKAISAISAAPFGSASILTISYAFIKMMGSEGLVNSTKMAILNANYVKFKLKGHYDVLYENHNGFNAHEVIVDFRELKKTANIEVADIAKRLMDYGFHSPTVSFPVAGTMMIEPTESESKAELDRFCEAMISIREEIREIEDGQFDQENNLLKNAPHTAAMVTADTWEYPYSRQRAAYPLEYVTDQKFWPSVSRIDEAYGDRNLICTCLPIEEYKEMEAFS